MGRDRSGHDGDRSAPAFRRRIGRRLPRIDGIVADGRRVSADRGLSLPAGTSNLRIEFGTVSLSSSSKLRFRYMLEGLDDEWVYAGNAREATYANVPSGNYRFRVSTTARRRVDRSRALGFLRRAAVLPHARVRRCSVGARLVADLRRRVVVAPAGGAERNTRWCSRNARG